MWGNTMSNTVVTVFQTVGGMGDGPLLRTATCGTLYPRFLRLSVRPLSLLWGAHTPFVY